MNVVDRIKDLNVGNIWREKSYAGRCYGDHLSFCSARIEEVELNSWIFQDYIEKINGTIEDARKGAKDVGRLLESK